MPVKSIDPLARSGTRYHSKIPEFQVFQQGILDCYCGTYAILNLVAFLHRKKQPNPRALFGAFEELHETLGFLGGSGPEGYQLLRSASAAFAMAEINARFSLRESIAAATMEHQEKQFQQSAHEKTLPARLGIDLSHDLSEGEGGVMALAAVHQCVGNSKTSWTVSDKSDKLGHWIALVGKSRLTNTELTGFGGIVLDSSRGYELWKIDSDGGLSLRRAGPADSEPEVRVWVYSLIRIELT